MAPWCPKCGGKWEKEGSLPRVVGEYSIGDDMNTHYVLILSGDRVEVICHYCGTTMNYLLSIEDEKQHLVDREVKLYKIIEELEEKLKKKQEGASEE